MDPSVQVAQVVPRTEAEGPGVRFAIWVQGCTIRCPGCCNPEMFPRSGGTTLSVDELLRHVADTRGIEGISLLGGEPFEQAAPLVALARAVQGAGLSVMIFTGYRLDELRRSGDRATLDLVAASDLIVDGRFERELPDRARRWVGSTNQEIHFLTPRYAPDDPRFREANTVEIHLRPKDGLVVVNGWPALAARFRP